MSHFVLVSLRKGAYIKDILTQRGGGVLPNADIFGWGEQNVLFSPIFRHFLINFAINIQFKYRFEIDLFLICTASIEDSQK